MSQPPVMIRRIRSPLALAACVLLANARVAQASSSTPFLTGSRSHPTAFAAGGFGGSKAQGSSGKQKSKRATKQKARTPTTDLLTPEGRMSYIQSRIRAADLSPMVSPTLTTNRASGDQLAPGIDPNAICVVDNFLGADIVAFLRSEAEALLPSMVPSQSTRWDETTQSVVPYEKHQVLSTQIEGGTKGYAASPRLVEYVVTLTQTLSAELNRNLPDIYQLSGAEQTNKLAVCLGDGSKYDKHIDNGGGSDTRKLTALLYLQPPHWHLENHYPNESEANDARGGYFRAYDVPVKDQVASIAPKGDRLLLFWSDSLVHDVSPSYAPNGDQDQRWALTVWFVVKKNGVIRTTDAEIEARHFGTG
jgi:hypothetical protein